MNIFSQAAGLFSLLAYSLYIISVFRGKTRPSRSTWWILTLVGLLILLSSYTIGARENIWIQLCYVAGPFIIALQSLKYGYGSKLYLVDKICLAGAFVCIFIWLIFNSPLIAFLGSIIVDFIGLIPTIQKSYTDPQEEDPTAWSIETVASILNAIGITAWFTLEDKSWIYALYLLIINGLITFILFRNTIKTFIKSK
jgi:hypothetical protein